jgi:hypothetical protein
MYSSCLECRPALVLRPEIVEPKNDAQFRSEMLYASMTWEIVSLTAARPNDSALKPRRTRRLRLSAWLFAPMRDQENDACSIASRVSGGDGSPPLFDLGNA